MFMKLGATQCYNNTNAASPAEYGGEGRAAGRAALHPLQQAAAVVSVESWSEEQQDRGCVELAEVAAMQNMREGAHAFEHLELGQA